MNKELAEWRVVVNSLVYMWSLVMNDIPWGLILGLVLFNMFVANMCSGIEYTASFLTDQPMLCGWLAGGKG